MSSGRSGKAELKRGGNCLFSASKFSQSFSSDQLSHPTAEEMAEQRAAEVQRHVVDRRCAVRYEHLMAFVKHRVSGAGGQRHEGVPAHRTANQQEKQNPVFREMSHLADREMQ